MFSLHRSGLQFAQTFPPSPMIKQQQQQNTYTLPTLLVSANIPAVARSHGTRSVNQLYLLPFRLNSTNTIATTADTTTTIIIIGACMRAYMKSPTKRNHVKPRIYNAQEQHWSVTAASQRGSRRVQARTPVLLYTRAPRTDTTHCSTCALLACVMCVCVFFSFSSKVYKYFFCVHMCSNGPAHNARERGPTGRVERRTRALLRTAQRMRARARPTAQHTTVHAADRKPESSAAHEIQKNQNRMITVRLKADVFHADPCRPTHARACIRDAPSHTHAHMHSIRSR